MTRLRATFLAALLLASGLGCTPTPQPSTGHSLTAAEALAQAERRWAANKVANYDFSIRVECFCFLPPIMTFQVRDDESSAPGLDAATRARVNSFATVEAVFALLSEHLKRQPATFEVDYDQTLGHPTKAAIDVSVNAADDELRFEIVELRLISGAAVYRHAPDGGLRGDPSKQEPERRASARIRRAQRGGPPRERPAA
jgi:hypothetical protein